MVMGFRKVRYDGQSALIVCHSALAVPSLAQNVGQIVMGFSKVRLELLQSAKSMKRGPSIGKRLPIVRFERDRPIEACKRLVKALELGKRVAAIAEGLGVVRLERDGLIVACQRVGEPPERLKDDASIVVGESRFGSIFNAILNAMRASSWLPRWAQISPSRCRLGKYCGCSAIACRQNSSAFSSCPASCDLSACSNGVSNGEGAAGNGIMVIVFDRQHLTERAKSPARCRQRAHH
jgi:hypothetical protein